MINFKRQLNPRKQERKAIWKLDTHEMYLSPSLNIYIMRVPGGLLYDAWDQNKDCFKHGIFINLGR